MRKQINQLKHPARRKRLVGYCTEEQKAKVVRAVRSMPPGISESDFIVQAVMEKVKEKSHEAR